MIHLHLTSNSTFLNVCKDCGFKIDSLRKVSTIEQEWYIIHFTSFEKHAAPACYPFSCHQQTLLPIETYTPNKSIQPHNTALSFPRTFNDI